MCPAIFLASLTVYPGNTFGVSPILFVLSASLQQFDASSGLFGGRQSIKANLGGISECTLVTMCCSSNRSQRAHRTRPVRMATPETQHSVFNDLFKCLSVPTDANLVLHQEKLGALYPELLSTKAIPCDYRNIQYDSVYWFRTVLATSQVQYLGRLNNANIPSHGKGVDASRFRFKRKGKMMFLLTIVNVTEEDMGIYSCVLTDRKGTEVWKSGILLLPGGL